MKKLKATVIALSCLVNISVFAQSRLETPNSQSMHIAVNGDYTAFREMVMKAPDGEVDAVATLRPDDIPLVRRARHASISRCNQDALSDYASFTQILLALAWKPDLVK
jgi:hypothetical protein